MPTPSPTPVPSLPTPAPITVAPVDVAVTEPWAWLTAAQAPWWSALVFSVVAALLTYWLTRREKRASAAREDLHRMQDLQRAAYAKFLAAANELERLTLERQPASGAVRALADAVTELELVAPEHIRVLAVDLHVAAVKMKFPDAESHLTYANAQLLFRTAARSSLSVAGGPRELPGEPQNA